MQKFATPAIAVALLLSGCVGMDTTTDEAAKDGSFPATTQSQPNVSNTLGIDGGVAAGTTRPDERSATPPRTEPSVVGGAPMLRSRNIIDNAANSRDHTTLVAALRTAGLVETLRGIGPFTVFAPTNAAFSALPAGTVDGMLLPANKPALTKLLTFHVVPGRVDAAVLAREIRAGNGIAKLRTASGGTLAATMRGGKIVVTDATGASATVTIADVYQSNGVIHVVDKVLLPR